MYVENWTNLNDVFKIMFTTGGCGATGGDLGGLVHNQFSPNSIFQIVQNWRDMLGDGAYVPEWYFNLPIMRAYWAHNWNETSFVNDKNEFNWNDSIVKRLSNL